MRRLSALWFPVSVFVVQLCFSTTLASFLSSVILTSLTLFSLNSSSPASLWSILLYRPLPKSLFPSHSSARYLSLAVSFGFNALLVYFIYKCYITPAKLWHSSRYSGWQIAKSGFDSWYGKYLPLLENVQTDSVVLAAQYSMGPMGWNLKNARTYTPCPHTHLWRRAQSSTATTLPVDFPWNIALLWQPLLICCIDLFSNSLVKGSQGDNKWRSINLISDSSSYEQATWCDDRWALSPLQRRGQQAMLSLAVAPLLIAVQTVGRKPHSRPNAEGGS